jgi:dihydrolipoamide dehydrogenase
MVMGDLVREVDVAVVGGGPGGYAAAFRTADLGLETVVIDAGERLGGTCLHEGCIPSKALLHVARVLADAERARDFGIDFGEPHIALDALRKWTTERVVGKLARGLASTARAKGVELIGGRAVFEGSRVLRVEGEAPQKIRFRHAVIATGSAAVWPPDVEHGERVLDSTRALALPDIPERLCVVGRDYIAVELGQVYAALGSRVTLADASDVLLPGVDRDLVQPLARRIEKAFSAVRLRASVGTIREHGSEVEVTLGDATERFDRVLITIGRRAATEGLGLETTKVRPNGDGTIRVDERCRTGDPAIHAVGDVTGEPMLAHRAMRQGKVAAEAIAGRASGFDNVVIPAAVFTDPEVAWCGLSEADASREHRPIKVARFQWAASGRATTLGRTDGLTKLIADAESGRLLGAGIVGPGASDLIAELALAVECGLMAEDLALTIHTHPTVSETVMEAAGSLLTDR